MAALQERADGINLIQRGERVDGDGRAIDPLQPGTRATGMTSDRLRVETPVFGVFIFGRACRTHGKRPHGGVRAIIGNRFDDGQARATMRAIGEGIAITSAERIEHFLDAFGAARRIGDDTGMHGSGMAGDDTKTRVVRQDGGRAAFDGVDTRQQWSLARQGQFEGFHRSARAAHVNVYAFAIVAYPAAQAVTPCQPPDGRAKADALHQAADADQLRRVRHGLLNHRA